MTNAPKISRRDVMIGTGASMITIGLNTNIARAGDALDTALAPRILGNPDAPILMAEYFSLSCSHCANFHHSAFKISKRTGLIPVSCTLRCVTSLYRPAIFAHALARSVPVLSGMLDILFKKQRDWAASDDPLGELARIARIAGIGEDAFTEIVQNRPLLEGIVAIAQEGYNKFQINSTPSFVINEDKVLRGAAIMTASVCVE